MRVERAIFTSHEHRDVRGYHLVARSEGIDDSVAQRLSVIAPTHDSLDGLNLEVCSLNYCYLNDLAILSRTAYGGPEYSDRGSFRIVTTFLVMPIEGLEGFGSNPLLFTRISQALGWLSVPFPIDRQIDAIDMVPQSILAQFPVPAQVNVDQRLVHKLTDSLGDSRPIAIIGAHDPAATMQQLYSLLSEEVRLWVSYSTHLKPSIHRPFRLQFCSPCDSRRISTLESRGFRCLQSN